MAYAQTGMETEATSETETTLETKKTDPNYVLSQLSKLDKLDKIDKLESKIDSFQDSLKSSVNHQNNKIAALEQRNSYLEQSNFKLERAIDDLWKEVHGKNLILRGLEDKHDENSFSLFQNVCAILRIITEVDIEPDVVYRMGEFVRGVNRPIRIVLCKHRERNLIFEYRANLDKHLTIAADLPTDMRVDFAILFKKKDELTKQGEACKIDFKAREITTVSGKGFASVHGNLQPIDNTKTPRFYGRANFEISKNGRGIKRSFSQPNQNETTNLDGPSSSLKHPRTDWTNRNDQILPQDPST